LKLFVVILAAALGLELLTLASDMAANSALRAKNPETTAFIRTHELRGKPRVELQWRDLPQISNHLKRAVLTAEDDTFLEHEGLNMEEFKKSIELNLRKRKFARGGSTITMQLVKNLYFSPVKNPVRKLNEILLAFDLERKLSKERILEIYLNVVEWGDGVYGAQNASRHYFQKDARDLNASEAAYLAAILPNPARLGASGNSRAQKRKAKILRRMSGQEIPTSSPPSPKLDIALPAR
jgi:monofunctional biosynthetic peptidoglycan transglycosylase